MTNSVRQTPRTPVVTKIVLVLLGFLLAVPLSSTDALWQLDPNAVVLLRASIDGTRYATVHRDRTVRVWDANNHQMVTSFNLPTYPFLSSHDVFYVGDLAFSPDNQVLALGFTGDSDFGLVWVTNLATGNVLAELVNSNTVQSVAFSPDGSELAVIGAWSATYELHIYDTATYGLETKILLRGPARGLAWSPTGDRLASGNGSAPFSVWESGTWLELYAASGNDYEIQTTSIAWSPDESRITSVGGDGIVRIWNAATGQAMSTFTAYVRQHTLGMVAWSPDGAQVVSATGTTIDIWDVVTNERVSSLDTGNGFAGLFWRPGEIIYASAVVQTLTPPVNTPTPIPTETATPSDTPTATPTVTATSTATSTATPTVTSTPTATPTETLTPPPSTCDITVAAADVAELISAITAANGNGTPDTICLTNSTYTLTAIDNTTDGANGLPSITGDLTLVGNGATITRDSAAPAFRLVHIAAGGSLTLENVTLSGGSASGSAPGDDGGAIYNRGTLTLSGNSAATDGGAVLAVGNVTLRDGSTIADNTAGDDGGGLYLTDSSPTVLDSTIAANSAGDQGGGLRAVGSSLSFSNSQLSGNRAPSASGGGLFATSSTLTFSGGAISGNNASSGGGLYLTNSPAPAQLENGVQITNNSAVSGGGLYVSTDGQVALTNATVSGNQASSSAAGIWAGGTVTLTTSTVANNGSATAPGAGVYVAGAGSVALSGGTVSDNNAARGGGLYSTGSLTLGATVSANTAASHGGGLYVAGGAALVSASTFDGNTAGDRGGGILSNAALQVETSRFSANHASGRGGAVYLGSVTDSWLWTSCLAGNTSPDTGGVYSAPSGFDAANNWWGAADGPSGAGAGSGDAVNANVGFTPFVTTECPAGTGAGGAGLTALQARSPRLLVTPALTPLRLPLSFTFEDETGWQADGAWLLDTLSGHTSAPGWAVSTVPRGQDSRLELSAPLEVSRGRTPRLRAWLRGQLAANDQARVEVLPQGATEWSTVAQWTSIPAEWAEQTVDLSAYRGQTIRLRFRVVSGGELSAGERSTGLWLDDLTIDTR